ncbi:hypothetical protein HDU67_000454 [Dinochytrium kinnereticum]|nr:hypothetical protein HDU67_000454 [Dinochytrium kinnereticum]
MLCLHSNADALVPFRQVSSKLHSYPDQNLIADVLKAIQFGVNIGFRGPRVPKVGRNSPSTHEYAAQIRSAPKSDGSRRTTHNLSWPHNSSFVNAGIPDYRAQLVYERCDDLLKLVGLLEYACKVLPAARPFLRRLIEAAYSVKRLSHRISPSASVQEDLALPPTVEWCSAPLLVAVDLLQRLAPAASLTPTTPGSLPTGTFREMCRISCTTAGPPLRAACPAPPNDSLSPSAAPASSSTRTAAPLPASELTLSASTPEIGKEERSVGVYEEHGKRATWKEVAMAVKKTNDDPEGASKEE